MISSFINLGLSGLELVAVILAYSLAVFFALGIHEFAHAFIAYKNGDDTAKLLGRLSINPFKHVDAWGLCAFIFVGFGWAKPVPINPLKFRNYKKGMFYVSISGVLTNLVIAFISSLFAYLMSSVSQLNTFYFFVYILFVFSAQINIALAVFNILPIYPLDGFNTIATFLKYDNKFVSFMRQYGQFILLLLIITGAFSFVLSFVVNGIIGGFYGLWGLMF